MSWGKVKKNISSPTNAAAGVLKVTIGPFEVAGGLGGALRVSRTLRGAIEVLGTLLRFSAPHVLTEVVHPREIYFGSNHWNIYIRGIFYYNHSSGM